LLEAPNGSLNATMLGAKHTTTIRDEVRAELILVWEETLQQDGRKALWITEDLRARDISAVKKRFVYLARVV